MMPHQCKLLLSFLFVISFTTSSSAQLIAYEPFDYPQDTHIFGGFGNGGTGWLDSWQSRGGNFNQEIFTAQEEGLTYTDELGNELTVAGNYALADFNGFDDDFELGGAGNVQMYRDVLAEGTIGDLVGGAGNSYFISFIGERRGATNTEAIGNSPHDPNEYSRNAHLSLTSIRGNEEAQIGNPSNQRTDTWKIRAKDTPDADSGVQFSFNQSFVVAKVTVGEIGAGETDRIDMWVNPLLASESAAGDPDATHLVFDDNDPFTMNHIGIGAYVGSQSGGRAGGVMAFDEIRIGHAWEDVTPFEGSRDVEPPACEPGTGDFDGNGRVEFADFLVLSTTFGTAAGPDQGDIDCNGTVEFADFLVLSANFGQEVAAAQVPEPHGLLLCGMGCIALAYLRQSRSSC